MLGTDGGSWASRSTIYWEKAFTCVLSWAYQNLASSQFGQDKATVDVLGMCIYAHPFSMRVYRVVKGEVISISAWALDVARSTVMGIPEPLRVGRVTTVSRFFCVVTQDFRAKV